MTVTIPSAGHDHEQLLAEMQSMRAGDADWKDARTWSLVYYAGEKHHALLEKAHRIFFAENALNPMAFKSLKRMETEVISMTAAMLNGPPTAVGTMTTGGTESVLMAVKAARDRAKVKKPWILWPEIVAPRTTHVALGKAAHYFGLKVRYVDEGPDLRADVQAMKRAVTRDTVLITASAPQYPHGVVDPIADIGIIAAENDLPFHVDACVGGFVLPWVEKLGYPVPLFDFRVPGVTSISADLHKYGFAAKGASTIIYRDMSYLKHQFFVSTDWPGGIYASPSMTGTRAGGPIAAAWASLMAMGTEGFLDHTRRAMEAATALAAGLRAIPGLEVLGKPDATIVTWRSTSLDTYAIADRLEERGWHIDRQQKPPSIHCTVTSNHTGVVDQYLADVAAAVEEVRAHPELASKGNAAMYGMMAKVPFRGLVKHSIGKVMEAMYAPGVVVPDLTKADDGVVGQIVAKYGDKAMGVLDSATRLRDRILGKRT